MKPRMENIGNEQGDGRRGDIPAAGADAGEPIETQVASLTDAEIQGLKAEAEKARHYYEQWARTTADLDNYKKRATRERQDAIKFANEALIEKLIPVLDNFDSALTATAQASGTASTQSLQTGVNMILQQLRNVLTEAGLEEIDASNKPFDPNWHEAL
jgi:molecular chaperone GrpE